MLRREFFAAAPLVLTEGARVTDKYLRSGVDPKRVNRAPWIASGVIATPRRSVRLVSSRDSPWPLFESTPKTYNT